MIGVDDNRYTGPVRCDSTDHTGFGGVRVNNVIALLFDKIGERFQRTKIAANVIAPL